MKIKILANAFALLFFLAAGAVADEDVKTTDREPRSFKFNYGAIVKDLPEHSSVRVWMPIPSSAEFQQIKINQTRLPGDLQHHTGKKYGNRIGYFESSNDDSDQIPFSIEYEVKRLESKFDVAKNALTEMERKKFLRENQLVPISGKPLKLIQEAQLSTDAFILGRELYDVVEQYMAYDKTQPGYGNGDVLWACNSRTGNCTDFHSLFISLARSRKLPARFEIGFPIPPNKLAGKISGYHCWAWFYTDQYGWVPVDISEADKHPELKSYYFGRLTPDRIAFSTGRDIELIPAANSGPLNYFVYPHVEVNGQAWPKEKMEYKFSFEQTSRSATDRDKQ